MVLISMTFLLLITEETTAFVTRRPFPPPRGLVVDTTRRSLASATLPEGIVKTVSQEGQGPPLELGDIATVKYSCYVVPTEKNKSNPAPFAKSSKQKVVVGDGSMIDGWDKALRTMRVGERSIVRIHNAQDFGYGPQGVPPVVPPNAELEFDIRILDAQPATANIDFDSLATADRTPRTASEIAAAFEQRQAVRAAEMEGKEQKEGLEAFLEKAKNFYFFGLFEGETGERPPWFLRPSITFPLAFVTVGAAFYVTFAGGGINQRGAQIKDELDEIILSTGTSPATASVVLALVGLVATANGLDL